MKELKPPKNFFIPDGMMIVQSKTSCEGCVYDVSKDVNQNITCSFAAENGVHESAVNINGKDEVTYMKRDPRCSSKSNSLRVPIIYKRR